MNLAPVFKQRFFDGSGAPLAGGQLFSYAAGTTTPQATYSNATGTANANPVVLDSQGYADIWLDPTLAYKIVLKDSGGNTIFTEDNVVFSTGISTYSSTQVYAQGQIVQDASGQGLLYVSLTNNNVGNPLTSVSNWRIFDGNVRTVSTSQTNPTLLVTDNLIRSNSTSGNLTHTLPACSTTPIGKLLTVKDIGTGGNTTSVKGAGSDNIDGNNTYALALSLYGSLTVRNNGTAWEVVNLHPNATISTAEIAAKAVTAAKIADNTITAAQIANATITGTQVVGKTLTNASIASGIYTGPIAAAYTGSSVGSITLAPSAGQIILGELFAGAADVTISYSGATKTVTTGTIEFIVVPPTESFFASSGANFTIRYITLSNNA